MIHDAVNILSGWSVIDTWIVITGALAAMACAVPGCYLVLRRQSMMGDALSHTALLGVVTAFILAQLVLSAGWISVATFGAFKHGVLFAGALCIGMLTALLTEWIAERGAMERGAALGVVFTVLFALGLLLIRLFADTAHIDPDCVLYGLVELSYVGVGVPEAAIVNGGMLVVNLLLVLLFFKELRISAFDPALATSLGIPARVMHYGLMASTAVTLVAAFESVGAILVIAMLITPAATAHLLTDKLWKMIPLAMAIAALTALLGHAMAIVAPPLVFTALGYPEVKDASSAGMMAVCGGLMFALAMIAAPRYGLLSRGVQRASLGLKIAAEDLLGLLYRFEERRGDRGADLKAYMAAQRQHVLAFGPWIRFLAVRRLLWRGLIAADGGGNGFRLTERGRGAAQGLVRGHRLWETYLAQHFPLPADQLHESAARAEHFIDAKGREKLAGELADGVRLDPHGREIPRESAVVPPSAEPPGT